MSEKLKPCPHCGGEAFLSDDDSVAFYVGCDNGVCEVSPWLERASKADAIAAWNRRAPDPRIEKAREALAAGAKLDPTDRLYPFRASEVIARALAALDEEVTP